LEAHGSRIHWRYLDDRAFIDALRSKIVEEAEEVANAQDRQELINELADLVEVIDALKDMHKIAHTDIMAAKDAKFKERGGFSGRKFVDFAEHPEGSYGEQYCLLDPQKYSEIKRP